MRSSPHAGASPARAHPSRPDHLVLWPSGIGVPGAGPVLVDDELADPEFSSAAWTARVRDGGGAVVTCVVHDRAGAGSPWRTRLDRVVQAVRDADGRFTGDAVPTSPARQRDWTRAALCLLRPELMRAPAPGTGSRGVDDVVLVVDELVTNVGQHAGGWVTIDLVIDGDGVLVAVSDPHPDAPVVPRETAHGDVAGRGLRVVAAIAPTWGVLVGRNAKSVWAWVPMAGLGDPATVGQ